MGWEPPRQQTHRCPHNLNEPLPFPDASFETALLSDVLEHLSDPQLLLEEVRRILSPSGTLLLNVPFLYWLHEQPHDYFRFTEHALRMMMERAGLRLVVLERLGGGVEVLADLVGKHVQLAPFVGGWLAQSLQWATFHASRSQPVRHLLAPSRQRFPLAYFLVAQRPSETLEQ